MAGGGVKSADDAVVSTPRSPLVGINRGERSTWLDSLLDAFGQDVMSEPPPPSSDGDRLFDGGFGAGAVIGDRYEVSRTVALSEAGDVLLAAYDRLLDKPVTLKSVIGAESDEERAAGLLHELLTARTVSHLNVCRVHDIVSAGVLGCMLVMEPCSTTLRKRLDDRRGPCDLVEYRSIAAQLGSALEALHGRGLIHGALQPANVLLDDDRAMILFGLGTEHAGGDGSRSSNACYYAPERLWDGFATRSDDVYALAAILWEVLSGKQPTMGRTPRLEPLLKHVDPATVLGLSVPEIRLLHRALSEDANLRPSASDLHRGLGGSPSRRAPVRRSVAPGVPPGAAEEQFVPNRQGLLVLSAGAAPSLVGRLFPLSQPEMTVGRSNQDVCLPEATVSRRHARLVWNKGSWLLQDLDSGYGVHGAHSHHRRKELVLRHADEVQIAAVRLKLVRFAPDSMEHWRARRFLTTRDGLTGLPSGASFLAELNEESAFASWLGSTLRVGSFRIIVEQSTPEPVVLIALQRFCEAVLRNLDEMLPSAGVAGFVQRQRLKDGGEASLFVGLTRTRKSEATRLVAEVAAAASQVLPRRVQVVTDVVDIDPAEELLLQIGHAV